MLVLVEHRQRAFGTASQIGIAAPVQVGLGQRVRLQRLGDGFAVDQYDLERQAVMDALIVIGEFEVDAQQENLMQGEGYKHCQLQARGYVHHRDLVPQRCGRVFQRCDVVAHPLARAKMDVAL